MPLIEKHFDRIVRERERRAVTGIPTTTWYMLMAKGLAPRPVPLGARARGWVLSELLAFNAQHIAKRDARAS